MRQAAAELLDRREILPGQWLISFRAPPIASAARAGQFVQLPPGGGIMRRPVPINTADPASGAITIHVRFSARERDGPSRLRPGDSIPIVGPLGRPFEVDPRSRHLLLAAGGIGIASVRMVADEAVRDGRQVTLLFGASSARDVYPSSLLPDEVEYVVATEDGSLGHRGGIAELVPAYEAWADQAFAAGPVSLLAAVARLAASRRQRLGVASLGRKRGGGRQQPAGSPGSRRKAFLQVSLDHDLGCAAATCLGCVVMGTGGPLRVCREGPAFAADEIAWEILA